MTLLSGDRVYVSVDSLVAQQQLSSCPQLGAHHHTFSGGVLLLIMCVSCVCCCHLDVFI